MGDRFTGLGWEYGFRIYWAALLFFLTTLALPADVIILRDGYVIQGTVLQTNVDGILIQRDYGTYTYPEPTIRRIHREPAVSAPEDAARGALPDWGVMVLRLAHQKWSANMSQIPASVIRTGLYERVPYVSFRCGVDYQFNIYGDPNRPAGVEIGMFRSLLKSEEARTNCLEFAVGLLREESVRKTLGRMNPERDRVQTNGLTLAIISPVDPGSRRGWWVSIYAPALLAQARATESEMKRITAPVKASKTPTKDGMGKASDATYVKGYRRKDGTYVEGHVRRK